MRCSTETIGLHYTKQELFARQDFNVSDISLALYPACVTVKCNLVIQTILCNSQTLSSRTRFLYIA